MQFPNPHYSQENEFILKDEARRRAFELFPVI